MITVRRSEERGHADHGWLDTFHTFSFAGYHDPRHMGFRALRVINEDRVQPDRGFGAHSHRDMEIVTYVVSGSLEHKDSMGNGSVIQPGDVQRMSAGTGVTHSEFNHSAVDTVHLLQIWILPEREGVPPSYEQKHFSAAERSGGPRLIASREGRAGSVRLHQDADIYASILAPGESVGHVIASGRAVWVQMVRGEAVVNGEVLRAGDGAAISDAAHVGIDAVRDSEILVFDLA
jgi:redox-sensitive bicupin YhaK (pirin superfamily)